MSREILFRGKRTDDNQWIFGSYVQQYGTHKIYLPDGTDSEYGSDNYTVIPYTVGQYIGLTDKNGKKIFEGDIVDVDGENGVVKYGDFIPKFYAQEVFHSSPIKGFYVETVNGEQLVIPSKVRTNVIGNIHDNPELLEVHNG